MTSAEEGHAPSLRPTVGSLFSGIGGLDLGLERAGFEVKWQCENDDFCRRVLAKHWPGVPCYGDIRELDGHSLEPVDLICGGFPCQPTSHAGRRRGEADDRWLWPEMLRLIREVKPAYVLGENVFGLVTHKRGLLLASVIADLEAEGYEVAPPVVFPACAVGALHRRDRVWVCAYARHHDRRAEQGQQQGQRAEVVDGVRQSNPDAHGDRCSRPAPTRQAGKDIPVVAGLGAPGGEQQRACTDARVVRHGLEEASLLTGRTCTERRCRWATEPAVGRVAHGVPSRVDRLRALGNAVVPQVAEYIGRQLMKLISPVEEE
jgi:DNA (cytosine-5)-methyltransferase 1